MADLKKELELLRLEQFPDNDATKDRVNPGDHMNMKELQVAEAEKVPRRPSRRRVILLGPHDRYNFGDLLFEKVVSKLLLDRAGYLEEELLYGGVLSVDMSRHQGRSDIQSMKKLMELSHKEGPFDIVYLGGEASKCDFACAVRMLPTKEQKKRAKSQKASDCGYWFPKKKLVAASYTGPENYAIINSAGGGVARKGTECYAAYQSANYKSFRDRAPLFPDSAVMVKHLFGDFISDINNFPQVRKITAKLNGGKYIAVQHKLKGLNEVSLARELDEIAEKTNGTIVFFAAGTVPGHDSFTSYHKVSKHMTMPSVVFEEETVWSVVALIAHANAVLSTSLHVRIIGFIFQKPRVTWCKNTKHTKFIELWDTSSSKCIQHPMAWSKLNVMLQQKKANHTVDQLVQQYLKNFDAWSSLLINRK